jgi:Trk K+ transport system NAD-binding subunit
MSFDAQLVVALLIFSLIALASRQIGDFFTRIHLPLVTGFLLTGMLVGFPLFQWALHLAGEAHVRAGRHDLRGTPVAFVFGVEGQSRALARQLHDHGWRIKMIALETEPIEQAPQRAIEVVSVPDLTAASLEKAGAAEARAFIAMMKDEENLEICRAAYEQFGIQSVIVRSQDHAFWERYEALGATVVDPGMAMVNLLDHFVRSPSATAPLLGMERDQDVIEFVVRNPDLNGLALRDLSLLVDTLVLSIFRKRASLICHGYTRLEMRDRVTIVGSKGSLEDVRLKFYA